MNSRAKAKLRKLAALIASVPRKAFDMDSWADSEKWQEGDNFEALPLVCEASMGKCGTHCCIAGWAIVHAGYCLNANLDVTNKKGKVMDDSPGVFAAKLLGLDREQAGRLFYEQQWPEEFKPTPKGAARRILHLAETGE